ncbi:MAG: cupredoxin domain-containing protein [Deltaproteobacteria bacterium]|nr:cupredoxin domain-containing protein [Deltaproteobacteria bacterium]
MKKTIFLILSLMLFFSGAAFSDSSFEIKANKPGFEPTSITIKKGEKVVIKFTSTDVAHGINLDEFGLKNTIIPEKDSVTLEFTADKTGTFSFPCTKYCSWRHLIGARPRLEIKVIE